MDIAHKYTTVNNVNIHYVEAGESHRPTIFFLHGFPEYWHTWHKQMAYFSDDFRVIAPDLPGYNLSDKPTNNDFYQVPQLVKFIADLIQQLSQKQPVYLVAHDWGGAISWPLAAFYPHLIEKLIILNAAHPSAFTREMINNPIQRQKSDYIHELIEDDAEERLTKNNFDYLSNKIFENLKLGAISHEEKKAYHQVWSQPGAVKGMLQYYKAMPQLAPRESDAQSNGGPITDTSSMTIPNIRITLPTLILWGEQDQAFVVENLEGLSPYIPNLTIKRFPEASHWLQHEYPQAVNQEIKAFISKTVS